MIKKNMEWETAEFHRHFKREYNEFKMFINGELNIEFVWKISAD